MRARTGIQASAWGWAAIGTTAMSAIGYALQTALDHIPEPATIGWLVFYVLFIGDGFAALCTGIVAVLAGWNRGDRTLLFGVIAIAWVVLAQTIQSLWD